VLGEVLIVSLVRRDRVVDLALNEALAPAGSWSPSVSLTRRRDRRTAAELRMPRSKVAVSPGAMTWVGTGTLSAKAREAVTAVGFADRAAGRESA
jgi:hypothetical protein